MFIAACKLGIPWLGLIHDWSKFRPSEWFPYVAHFYGKNAGKQIRDETGYYKPTDTGDPAFDQAWFLHQKRNRHHWQYWVMPEDVEGVKILSIPDKYRREMLADWRGAGRAQRRPNTKAWYTKNCKKLQLHEETRHWIEDNLGR